MQQDLYIFAASDVRRASKPGISRANIVNTVAVPALKLKNTSATAGGGVSDVNWVLPQTEAPEPKFGTNGPDPDIFDGMGQSDIWTFAGAFKKQNGLMVPCRAIIEGIVSEWEPDEQSSGELMKCSHVFQEVTHYELLLDNEELFYMDWGERALRMAGKSLTGTLNQALGLPG